MEETEKQLPYVDYRIPVSFAIPYQPTQREYFAAKALASFIGSAYQPGGPACLTSANGMTAPATPFLLAEMAIEQADALIAALNKEGSK